MTELFRGPGTTNIRRIRREMSQALLEQPFVKDHSFSFGDFLRNTEQELKVMLNIKRVTRYGPTACR